MSGEELINEAKRLYHAWFVYNRKNRVIDLVTRAIEQFKLKQQWNEVIAAIQQVVEYYPDVDFSLELALAHQNLGQTETATELRVIRAELYLLFAKVFNDPIKIFTENRFGKRLFEINEMYIESLLNNDQFEQAVAQIVVQLEMCNELKVNPSRYLFMLSLCKLLLNDETVADELVNQYSAIDLDREIRLMSCFETALTKRDASIAEDGLRAYAKEVDMKESDYALAVKVVEKISLHIKN